MRITLARSAGENHICIKNRDGERESTSLEAERRRRRAADAAQT